MVLADGRTFAGRNHRRGRDQVADARAGPRLRRQAQVLGLRLLPRVLRGRTPTDRLDRTRHALGAEYVARRRGAPLDPDAQGARPGIHTYISIVDVRAGQGLGSYDRYRRERDAFVSGERDAYDRTAR